MPHSRYLFHSYHCFSGAFRAAVFCIEVVMKKGIALLVLSCFLSPVLRARDSEVNVSPLYFGPNALPVPEMLDGTVSACPYAELSFDWSLGYHGDLTRTLTARVNIPLFSPRVNLSVWMPVVEFYTNTPESLEWQNSPGRKTSGYEIGTVYVSTDIQLMRQTRTRPDISVRAALVTASGDSEEYARYYDAPGYFIDASASKSIEFGHDFFKEVRLVLNAGFLCWQTDRSVQNDAYMYGVATALRTRMADFSLAWQGYTGWQKNGDRPMVLRAGIDFAAGKFVPFVSYEHGIRDYPFDRIFIGLGYRF